MRKIKFIQINIYKGKYLDELISFLKKENPDFVSMQEVTSGELNECQDKTLNIFDYLTAELEMNGHFAENGRLTDYPDSVFGNVILTRFPISDHKVITLKDFRNLPKSQFFDPAFWPDFKRCILDIVINVGDKMVHAMSLHGAWTAPPTDSEEAVRQAAVIADYLKSLSDEPFILGCDLNNVPESKVVGMISAVSNNIMLNSGVKQTTHPKIHKIVPRGYLIDYIFTSRHFVKKSLKVPEVTVSDHLPVVAELEFSP